MSVLEPLYQLIGVELSNFSKEEFVLLEAELLTRICEELKEFFKNSFKEYFRFLKLNPAMEDIMMEEKLVRCIINDILSTEEYSLIGIASYTNIPEDAIFEMATGKNTNPSSQFLRKIITLHRSVRPNLYREIMIKILRRQQIDKINEDQ